MGGNRNILRQGDTLAGFRIEDVIGLGGMGIVYLAEQTSLRRMVALKVLSPDLNADPEFRERFRREGQHVAALDHPNVVTVFDSGEVDGKLYMAMRLVDGETLAQRMVRTGITVRETLAILGPIAQALDAAHALGLVHRDVKPQNILVNEAGVPYLTDFGIARSGEGSGALTGTGSFVGSINYAAPEQILGESPTAACDVYAFTAVLYQCLSGQAPFPRGTDVAVMRAHLEDPPPTLSNGTSDSSALDTVIARGMAKDPNVRYQRASEAFNAAQAVLSKLPMDRLDTALGFEPDAAEAIASDDTIVRTVLMAPVIATPGEVTHDPPTAPATVSVSEPGEARFAASEVAAPLDGVDLATPGRVLQLLVVVVLAGMLAAALVCVGIVLTTVTGLRFVSGSRGLTVGVTDHPYNGVGIALAAAGVAVAVATACLVVQRRRSRI